MRKIIIFAIIVAFALAGCSAGNPQVKVIKINQTNASPNATIPSNITALNITANITSNATQNLTANLTANITSNASQPNATSNASPQVLKNLTVEFIDLNGNSVLIRTPSRKAVLIDGGDNSDGLKITKYLMSKGISKIDYVFNSNAEIENVGGLPSIMFNFNNSQAYYSGLSYDINNNIAYAHYISYSKAYSKPAIEIAESKSFDIGDGITLRALVPYENSTANGDLKDDTIVFKLEYNDASFLFLGDCRGACFDKIRDEGIESDVLKLNGYAPQGIIDEVSPKIIIYDKLSNDTIKPSGVKVYSKADGTVLIMSDGSRYFISTTGKA